MKINIFALDLHSSVYIRYKVSEVSQKLLTWCCKILNVSPAQYHNHCPCSGGGGATVLWECASCILGWGIKAINTGQVF